MSIKAIEVQVFFFQEQLQEQPVQPGVEIPVDEPQVVAGDVIAKVGELDALPFPSAAPFALHPTAKDLAADQLQSFQLRDKSASRRTEHGRSGGIVETSWT